MIISLGRQYVFVHAPKTGGTSLALALEARAKKDDIMFGDTPKARKRRGRAKDFTSRGRLWKHSTLADIEGVVASEELRQLFAFTLVRNPWDRMVSYYHWLQQQDFKHPAVTLAKYFSFQDFVQHPKILQALRSEPASYYMRHANGEEQCDAYIRLEHFEKDAAPLFAHLGFTFTLSRENRSERDTDYRGYYCDASRVAVAQACAQDIKRFGYEFA